ncbi:hypothetical protein SteCoe_8129 [Stentor coeruleus]|uniref:RNA helicase n=1 Tax=Stentor coeruleus TaxID=5963 RepID=A0A1R2CKZ5_9CILI|nr:hypothetical protein SteCoe_8129 [Stentor coeruleus]
MNPDIYSYSTFPALGIQKGFLLQALEYFGFSQATPVQEQCIPKALSGENLIVQAKNGTGKTLAFSLVALETVDPNDKGVQVLVLTATHEIANQICDFFNEMTYTSDVPIYTLLCCGGYSVKNTIQAIKEGVSVVIGTVGRVQHLSKTHLDLTNLKLLIFDEADKIATECRWLFELLPKACQILSFSATFNEPSEKFLKDKISNPIHIKCSGDDTKLKELQEYYTTCTNNFQNKLTKLIEILNTIPFHQCIVFHNYKSSGKDLATRLRDYGFPSLNISSDLSQDQRIEVIRSLRFLGIKVLLSTDITSRGLDVLNVNLVVNFEFPQSKEVYIHRVGRAGRFGTKGVSVTLCMCSEDIENVNKFSKVENLTEFNREEYMIREITEEEKKLCEEMRLGEVEDGEWVDMNNIENAEDEIKVLGENCEDGWIDVPLEESPEKVFVVPVFMKDLEAAQCQLCRIGRYDRHCHCVTCKYNYEFIVKYL